MAPFSFRAWYDTHKSAFNAARRRKYQEDPKYRKRVLEVSRVSKERLRKERLSERKREAGAIKINPPKRGWREIPSEDGKMFLSLGAVSKLVGRAPESLRNWERNGIIPETPNRTPRGMRLYTPTQVLEIRERLKKLGLLRDPNLGTQRPQRDTNVTLDVRFDDGKVKATNLFKMGVLAKSCGKSVVYMTSLIHKEHLPDTPLRTEGNHRVFTAQMIEAVKFAFDHSLTDSLRVRDWKLFRTLILDDWMNQKVLKACVEPKEKSDGR